MLHRRRRNRFTGTSPQDVLSHIKSENKCMEEEYKQEVAEMTKAKQASQHHDAPRALDSVLASLRRREEK